jgi:hypothetical protein
MTDLPLPDPVCLLPGSLWPGQGAACVGTEEEGLKKGANMRMKLGCLEECISMPISCISHCQWRLQWCRRGPK